MAGRYSPSGLDSFYASSGTEVPPGSLNYESMIIFALAQSAAPVLVDQIGREPQLAVADDGSVLVAYGRGNEILCRRLQSGMQSSEASLVTNAGKLSLGMRRGPRIARSGKYATITAIIGEKGGGADGDVRSFVSSDDGKTWKPGALVNDVPGSAREGLHAMAVAPDGTLACAWLDLRESGTTLTISSSKDHGTTWSKNVVAYRSPSGTICECCHPSLTYDSSGKLHILFRNAVDGNRDMYALTTKDLVSFSPATMQGGTSWRLAACPMDGGMVAVINGSTFSVWRREGTILTSSGASETNLGTGKNPWLTARNSNPVIAWQNGTVVMLSISGQAPIQLSEKGNDPVVETSGNGKHLVAAWNQSGGVYARFFD